MKYIVSCSGGVDSMALAHYLHKQGKLDSIFHFVYTNPPEFVLEAKTAVGILSDTLNVPLHLDYESKTPNSNNLESNWRHQRYKSLEKISKKLNTPAAVGHHMDDQLASYILSFLKNSSRCFIPPKNIIYNNTVYRPFIIEKFFKCDILEYAKENKIYYVDDPFNFYGDRSTVDLILPDLKNIKQTLPVFYKKYNKWYNKHYSNLEY